MTTSTKKVFVSPGAENDGDGTPSKPRNTLAGLPAGPGIELVLRRGSTSTMTLQLLASGTQEAPFTVSAYALDDGTDIPTWPKPRIWPTDPEQSGAVHLHDQSWITLRDLDLTTARQAGIGVYGFMSSPEAGRGIVLERIDTHGNNTGLVLYSLALNTGSVREGKATDCTFSGHGGHGSLLYGAVDGFTFERCRFDGNGQRVGAHGASSFAHRINFTGPEGWVMQPNGAHAREVGSVVGINGVPQQVHRCVSNSSLGTLVQHKRNPPAPRIGEYGFSDGVLYVNFGTAGPLPGYTVMAFVEQARRINYRHCVFSNTKSIDGEGSGVQWDDGSTGSLLDCISHDNGGSGAFANWGTGHSITGLLTYRNGLSGVTASAAPSMLLSRVTTIGNGESGIAMTNSSKGAKLANCRSVDERVGQVRDGTTTDIGSIFERCVENYAGDPK